MHLAALGAVVALSAAACSGDGAAGTATGPLVGSAASPAGSPAGDAATASDWGSAPVRADRGSLLLGDGSTPAVTVVHLSAGREAVEGTDYDVLPRAAPASSGAYVAPLALRADGRTFAARIPDDQYDGGAWLAEPSEVGLLDGATFTAWPSSATALEDRHPRQVYAASTDGTSAAWAETDSTQAGMSSWRIFAGDGGATRLVARSEDAGDGSEDLLIVEGDAEPLLRAGRVYWATPVPATDGDEPSSGVQVMSRSASTEDTAVVEARGASQPAVGAGGLYVARTTRDDPAVTDGTFSIDHVDADGIATPVLSSTGSRGTSVRSLVASGDRLAFVVASPDETGGKVVVLDVPTGAVTTVPLLPSGREVSLALCGDRLVWTSANGSTGVPDNASIGVLDVSTGDLSRVIEPDNFAGVQCAGDLVQWQTIDLPDGRGVPVVVRWTDG